MHVQVDYSVYFIGQEYSGWFSCIVHCMRHKQHIMELPQIPDFKAPPGLTTQLVCFKHTFVNCMLSSVYFPTLRLISSDGDWKCNCVGGGIRISIHVHTITSQFLNGVSCALMKRTEMMIFMRLKSLTVQVTGIPRLQLAHDRWGRHGTDPNRGCRGSGLTPSLVWGGVSQVRSLTLHFVNGRAACRVVGFSKFYGVFKTFISFFGTLDISATTNTPVSFFPPVWTGEPLVWLDRLRIVLFVSV